MNFPDFSSSLLYDVLFVVLPLILALGIWLFHRWSRRGLQYVIDMDGATCLKTNDGNVVIKRRTIFNWFALVFLGLCLLVFVIMSWSVLGDISRGDFNPLDVYEFLILFALFGAAVLSLIRSLRIPSVYFNADSRVLGIGSGSSMREISFSSVSRVVVKQDSAQGFHPKGILGYEIGIVLDNNEVVQLGTVSGSERSAEARAVAVAKLIAYTTGAPMPGGLR